MLILQGVCREVPHHNPHLAEAMGPSAAKPSWSKSHEKNGCHFCKEVYWLPVGWMEMESQDTKNVCYI